MMIEICDKCGDPKDLGMPGFMKITVEISPTTPFRVNPVLGESVRSLCIKCFKTIDDGWKNPFLVDRKDPADSAAGEDAL